MTVHDDALEAIVTLKRCLAEMTYPDAQDRTSTLNDVFSRQLNYMRATVRTHAAGSDSWDLFNTEMP